MISTDPDFPSLLQAANNVITAWEHPTMDGAVLLHAINELREIVTTENKEWRLAHKHDG